MPKMPHVQADSPQAGCPPDFIRGKETRMTADSLQKQSQGLTSPLFQKGKSGNPAVAGTTLLPQPIPP
jgi:hypothetical protein